MMQLQSVSQRYFVVDDTSRGQKLLDEEYNNLVTRLGWENRSLISSFALCVGVISMNNTLNCTTSSLIENIEFLFPIFLSYEVELGFVRHRVRQKSASANCVLSGIFYIVHSLTKSQESHVSRN